MAARLPSLRDFGLCRESRENHLAISFAFLEGRADPDRMEQAGEYSVILPAGRVSNVYSSLCFTYTKCVSQRTLVVFAAFLEEWLPDSDRTQRLTEMRAWQIIANAWLTSSDTQPAGRPEQLRYLGFHHVIEESSKAAMEREMEAQWSAGTAVQRGRRSIAEYTAAAGANWTMDPWIRCSQRVAAALSTPARQITVSRAWAELSGWDMYHLTVELTSVPVEAAPESPQEEEPEF